MFTRDDLLPVLVGHFPHPARWRPAMPHYSPGYRCGPVCAESTSATAAFTESESVMSILDRERQTADRLRDGRRAIEVQIGNGNGRAGARQASGDGFARCRCGACHDGRLAGEIEVHGEASKDRPGGLSYLYFYQNSARSSSYY